MLHRETDHSNRPEQSDLPVARFVGQTDFIGRVLREGFTIMLAEFDVAIAEVRSDATPAISRVLAHLDPEGTRIVELARRCGTTKQSMGELVVRMVERGLVEVHPVPGPGRGKLVVATPEGWEALRAGLDVVLGIHQRWSALIGTDEMTAIVSGLRNLIDHVKTHPAPPDRPPVRTDDAER